MFEFEMILGITGAVVGTMLLAYFNTMPVEPVFGSPAYKVARRKVMAQNLVIRVMT